MFRRLGKFRNFVKDGIAQGNGKNRYLDEWQTSAAPSTLSGAAGILAFSKSDVETQFSEAQSVVVGFS
jgi:hypothetical protein